MKRKVLKINAVMVCACLLIGFMSFSASAHEVLPNHRWAVMSKVGTIFRCNLSIDGGALDSNWSLVFTDARNNWNNNSNSRVSCTVGQASNSTENIYLSTWKLSASQWDATYGASTIAITLTRASRSSTVVCADSYPNCATRIKYAAIHFTTRSIFSVNGTSYSLTKADRTKTMVHEIGHALCLGHPSSTTTSIMRQGVMLGITTPQDHDRNDLAVYYNQLYS